MSSFELIQRRLDTTMIKITVKTIDSCNYDFEVEDNVSAKQTNQICLICLFAQIIVKDFKELIAPKVEISPDLQRLIFCGRVLVDDKTLKDYGIVCFVEVKMSLNSCFVEINDGKVVHLVKRAPPMSAGNRPASNPNSAQSSPRHTHAGRQRWTGRPADDNSYLVGAFTIPQEAFNPNGFQQMLQTMVQNMGDLGRNATVMSRTSEDGSSVDVQINLAQAQPQNECRQRLMYINRFIGYVNCIVDVIERPDSLPGVNEPNGANGSFTVDANNIGSMESQLEAQLAAQAAAAASTALGINLGPGLVVNGQTPEARNGQNTANRDQSRPRGGNTTTTNSNRNQPVTLAEVNELMNSASQAQERLRPHIQRYQQLLTSSERLSEQQLTEAQSLQRNCQRATHHLAHIFHLISDFTINFSNRTVGVNHSSHPPDSVSLSMPFNPPTESNRNSTPETTFNFVAPTPFSTQSDVNTAGSTTQSTNSVPRFSQSSSGDQSSSVYTAQTPIVVMEVGSTVERVQIPISNANSNANSTPHSNQTDNQRASRLPLLIPPFDPYLHW